MHVLVIAVLALTLAGTTVRSAVAGTPVVATAATVFCGIFVQALPFLVLGVLISGLVAAVVTPERLTRWVPHHPAAAVVVAGVSGAALPGCECGSVPIARRLYSDGAVGAAAVTFMLAAPAINPVVLVATAVAFPGEPAMVFARCAASFLTALTVGALWIRFGQPRWITRKMPDLHAHGGSRWAVFTEAARHDFLQAASFLVLGAAAAALLHIVVPSWMYDHLAGHLILGIAVMALLAVVLSLCSEADAFVAASLSMLPLLPRLVFLVVGPAVDLKLFAMQVGMFGRAFAVRFAPLTFVVATLMASGVGLLIVGNR
ncbi:permease [Mycolicibacterium obuense]|uniref:Membrane protein n=1 Tax=Mycolicibacterium obuense TaxID=1807 RepID=A0A0M2JYJ4_9MYCO|nr:permease [Mycolicibacterium obuense]KKF02166.1 membrane protein [Mycolicibacterium obuense]